MRLVRFATEDGTPLWVNPDRVAWVTRAADGGTRIWFSAIWTIDDGDWIEVGDDLEDVVEMLKGTGPNL